METSAHNVIDLSPDGYSRFFMMVDILEQLYKNQTKPVRILDVGGSSEFLGQQLAASNLKYELTILDILEQPPTITTAYIEGDATKMELQDNSFDAVVSTDTLEHIPGNLKRTFVSECLRVAKDVCIIAAPFQTEGVAAADLSVNDFNKKLFNGAGQQWLEEHLEYGQPTRDTITKVATKEKVLFDELGTQNLTTWLLNTHINLIDASLGLNTKNHVAVNRFYNKHILAMGDCDEPTYRRFFILYKDPAQQQSFDKTRYTTPRDPEKYARYITQLTSLFIEPLEQNQKLQTALQTAQQKAAVESHVRKHLEATVKQQAYTLNKLTPIIKLARTPPIRSLYRVVQRIKTGLK